MMHRPQTGYAHISDDDYGLALRTFQNLVIYGGALQLADRPHLTRTRSNNDMAIRLRRQLVL